MKYQIGSNYKPKLKNNPNTGMNTYSAYISGNNSKNNLKTRINSGKSSLNNLKKRKVAGKINSNNNRININYFKKEAENLLADLKNIINKVKNTNKITNSVKEIIVLIENIIGEIRQCRKKFASELRKRLAEEIKGNGKFNIYMYYTVNGYKIPEPNTYANALNATTKTINNYTAIVKTLKNNSSNSNYSKNLNTNNNSAGLSWPSIMEMDGILINYNQSATRISAAQNVNVNKMKTELNKATQNLKNMENKENRNAKNALILKLTRLAKAINKNSNIK